MPFRQFHGYGSSPQVIILCVSDMLYHLIPVAAFGGEQQVSTFLGRLEAAGVRRW